MEHRDEIVFATIDRTGRGLEIGAGHQPLAPKAKGFNCATLDYAPAWKIREKLASEGIDESLIAQVEEVDYLWGGERLPDIIDERFDYVLASHVVEHSVDLISFLNDCAGLLKPGGLLGLIIPDKRFCFDALRPITSIGQVVDSHDRGLKFHSVGTLMDQMAYAVARDGRSAWSRELNRGDFTLLHEPLSIINRNIDTARDQSRYLDLHRWTFTPKSFELLTRDLTEIGYTEMVPVASHDTVASEFFVTLARKSDVPTDEVDRIALLREIYDELGVQWRDHFLAQKDRIAQLEAELTTARAQHSAAANQLDRTLTSTSWKVTRPLRKLTGLRK